MYNVTGFDGAYNDVSMQFDRFSKAVNAMKDINLNEGAVFIERDLKFSCWYASYGTKLDISDIKPILPK
jgi:hypothetical protein